MVRASKPLWSDDHRLVHVHTVVVVMFLPHLHVSLEIPIPFWLCGLDFKIRPYNRCWIEGRSWLEHFALGKMVLLRGLG